MSVSREQLVQRAGVDDAYLDSLHELGALRGRDDTYEERDVNVAALLAMWERAGLSAPAILAAEESGMLSLDFLDSPAWEMPEPLPITYREFAEEHEIPLALLQRIQEAMGFAAPGPDDRVPRDDAVLAELARIVLDMGASDDAVQRLFRAYADNLRRLAMGEADLYLEEIEGSWVGSGAVESELILRGAELGRGWRGQSSERSARSTSGRVSTSGPGTAFSGPRWRSNELASWNGAESTPAICFVDMTGFTRLTEERGDQESARLATSLAAVVNDVSRAHGGRAIRWLGDGGLFYFEDVGAAFAAALVMSERAPDAGLPPTHIGIQAGPVVLRDGDVYGRTVNIASRIADQAEAGEVLTSQETMEQVGDDGMSFERARSVELKGIADPVTLYRVFRMDQR